MSDNGSVLAQSEIDNLFKKATGKNIASPPAAKPATSTTTSPPPTPTPTSAPAPAPAPTLAPAPEILKSLETAVTNLAQRITKVETTISEFNEEKRQTTDVGVITRQLSQRLEAVVKDLQRVNSHDSGILSGLEGTPDYNIRNNFTCESCGVHGSVAIPIKCTRCGGEGWWGWWPEKE